MILTYFALRKSGAAEMTIKTADMTTCSKKIKPLWGPNEGVAYDPEDPCPDGYYWDESVQDCLLIP